MDGKRGMPGRRINCYESSTPKVIPYAPRQIILGGGTFAKFGILACDPETGLDGHHDTYGQWLAHMLLLLTAYGHISEAGSIRGERLQILRDDSKETFDFVRNSCALMHS